MKTLNDVKNNGKSGNYTSPEMKEVIISAGMEFMVMSTVSGSVSEGYDIDEDEFNW